MVQIYSFVGKEHVCQGLRLLKTMDVNWNLFFPDIKYLTDYNYDIVENEWTQKKYTRVEKILELALLFSKLLNSRF